MTADTTHPPAGSRRHRIGLVALLICTAATTLPVSAATLVTGTIDQDTVWQGEVIIQGQVKIVAATVSAKPGTVIRFAETSNRYDQPAITLASPLRLSHQDDRQAKLLLLGTAESPVTVETPAGAKRGHIRATNIAGATVIARHVVFRRLGTDTSKTLGDTAISLTLASPRNDLWLSHCRFEQCGMIRAEMIGSGSVSTVQQCTFAKPSSRYALTLIGTAPGLRTISDNRSQAGFRIECPDVLVNRNVIIADQVCVDMPTSHATAVRVVDNYLECTTDKDTGTYVLRCETPGTLLERNTMIGGTYVIETAPTHVFDNVLIGVDKLELDLSMVKLTVSDKRKRRSKTHYLIANTPMQARIDGNLLLGPCYAMIALPPALADIEIRANVFDGWNAATRGIVLMQSFEWMRSQANNNATRQPASSRPSIVGNVFVRLEQDAICQRDLETSPTFTVSDTVVADVPMLICESLAETATEQNTQRLEAFSQLGFENTITTQSAKSLDDQLLKGDISPTEAYRRWRDAYSPDSQSPLATHPATRAAH
jgi:hypothetical protein